VVGSVPGFKYTNYYGDSGLNRHDFIKHWPWSAAPHVKVKNSGFRDCLPAYRMGRYKKLCGKEGCFEIRDPTICNKRNKCLTNSGYMLVSSDSPSELRIYTLYGAYEASEFVP
jgi:hypothetical protein